MPAGKRVAEVMLHENVGHAGVIATLGPRLPPPLSGKIHNFSLMAIAERADLTKASCWLHSRR